MPYAPVWSLAAQVAATWPGAGKPPPPAQAALQAAVERAVDPQRAALDFIAGLPQGDPHRWERNPELAVADWRDATRRWRSYAGIELHPRYQPYADEVRPSS